MNTRWIVVHSLLLEDGTLKQEHAGEVPNAVIVGLAEGTSGNVTKRVFLPIPPGRIDALRIGYRYLKWPTETRSRITKVQLLRMTAPVDGASPTILYEEVTRLPPTPVGDPPDTRYSFFTVEASPLFTHEGFWLTLHINFRDSRDRFLIGPVGIEDHNASLLEVNPMDFGAAGDGQQDDIAALERTFEYAVRNDVPINLAHRTYLIGSTLELRALPGNESGVKLRHGRIHYVGDANGTAVLISKEPGEGPGPGPFTPVQMEDVTITGRAATGLDMVRVGGSFFTNVRVVNTEVKDPRTREVIDDLHFQVGVRLRGAGLNDFLNCAFQGNGVNAQIESWVRVDEDDVLIDGPYRSNDNKFWSCDFSRSRGEAALYLHSVRYRRAGESVYEEAISGAENAFHSCRIENTARYCAVIENGHQTSFTDCRFERQFALEPSESPNPFTMMQLKEPGRNSRVLYCVFISRRRTVVPDPLPPDAVIRIGCRRREGDGVLLQHAGTQIVGCVFASSSTIIHDERIAIDGVKSYEAYGNWGLDNHFRQPIP